MGTAGELYETDFFAWTRVQAERIRLLKDLRLNLQLDVDHIAEEIEGLGSAARRAVRSQARRILEHFLKLAYSPAVQPRRAWRRSVLDARAELADELTATLRIDLEANLERLYQVARKTAILGLEEYAEEEAARLLPEECPFTLDDVLRDDWYPEPVVRVE